MCWACRSPQVGILKITATTTVPTTPTVPPSTPDRPTNPEPVYTHDVLVRITAERDEMRRALDEERAKIASAFALLRRDAPPLLAKTIGLDWAAIDEESRNASREVAEDLIAIFAARLGLST